jgi:HJR/Mrr/RecB family endonuclease
LDRDFARVDAEACLLDLSASLSKSPAELVPVRPVLEFNMVDPRFVEEADVLSGLDQRPNLMELKPGEFEALITNLFSKMGLETRMTQPSRDGGVDCVAFDNRAIFGGKVIIQAKRYKNTVPVSAVRDLFGSVHNEGATKGILVTTSGFGKASFDFANDKPLELLSGTNLLYLLKEHAGVDAKIEPPGHIGMIPHPTRRAFRIPMRRGEAAAAGRGANLWGARLSGADLGDAQLPGATLVARTLSAQLQDALADANTVWPEGFDWQKAGAVMRSNELGEDGGQTERLTDGPVAARACWSRGGRPPLAEEPAPPGEKVAVR